MTLRQLMSTLKPLVKKYGNLPVTVVGSHGLMEISQSKPFPVVRDDATGESWDREEWVHQSGAPKRFIPTHLVLDTVDSPEDDEITF